MDMNKLEKLTFAKQQLFQLADFLEDYIPLANTHTVEFLVNDLWEKTVPETIRTELLALSSKELARLPYDSPHLACDGATVRGRQDSEKRPPEKTIFSDQQRIFLQKRVHITGKRPTLDRNKRTNWKHRHLHDFVGATHIHTLRGLNVLSELADVLNLTECRTLNMRQFMSAKKAHEVDIMAEVCTGLCQDRNINQVVDIGSGLGYLCGHLAFLHNFNVLGIDACNSNTHGAQKRSSKLAKHWPVLLANALLAQKGLPPVRTKGKKKQKNKVSHKECADQQNAEHADVEQPAELQEQHTYHKEQARREESNEIITGDSSVAQISDKDDFEGLIPPEDFSMMVTSLREMKQLAPKGHYVPVTMFVSEGTDLLGLLQEYFGNSEDSILVSSSKSKEGEKSVKCMSSDVIKCRRDLSSSLTGSTAFYENTGKNSENNQSKFLKCESSGGFHDKICDTSFPRNHDALHDVKSVIRKDNLQERLSRLALQENSIDDAISQKSQPEKCGDREFIMTGLHTCGDLASTVLKLFVKNPSATRLCNVGCCYHLLEEEFVRNKFLKDDDPDPDDVGFPLSECLRDRGYGLGRNARMLSCQAPARLSVVTEHGPGPERALHWRAMLQVILENLTGESRDDWNVGKISNKCTSFMNYTRAALRKLKIEKQITDEDILEYEKKHAGGESTIRCFFYLRATLSLCIESLILLDRLVFLLEQDCVSNAHLVELFDPKTSPRCYAVLAIK